MIQMPGGPCSLFNSTCGEKKLEHGPHASGPAGLVVHAAGYALKVQRVALAPAVGYEPSVELRGVLKGSLAFAVAHIEPHARPFPYLGCAFIHVAENALVIPPDAGR